MSYEQKDFTGSLFKNDQKITENHPNAKGTAKIDGVEYWVAAWTKKDKNGNPWQSLAFTPKDEKRGDGKPSNPRDLSDIESDIPF